VNDILTSTYNVQVSAVDSKSESEAVYELVHPGLLLKELLMLVENMPRQF
jgi:hypothetical protein